MAAASHTLSLHHHSRIYIPQRDLKTTLTRNRKKLCTRVFSELAQESSEEKKQQQGKRVGAPPKGDTRIHWENDDEGWIGGRAATDSRRETVEDPEDLLARKFSDLLKNSDDSHYQFLGVPPDADLEEIKSAYRRLSKEYHPDTTTLPLKSASEKFMQLRDIYAVLSDTEKRNFYDWTLAQEAASREREKMRMKLEDPYMKDLENYVPVPDMVDRLGGKNMELSDQAMSALGFDIIIVVFSICCIIYVALFKDTY